MKERKKCRDKPRLLFACYRRLQGKILKYPRRVEKSCEDQDSSLARVLLSLRPSRRTQRNSSCHSFFFNSFLFFSYSLLYVIVSRPLPPQKKGKKKKEKNGLDDLMNGEVTGVADQLWVLDPVRKHCILSPSPFRSCLYSIFIYMTDYYYYFI